MQKHGETQNKHADSDSSSSEDKRRDSKNVLTEMDRK